MNFQAQAAAARLEAERIQEKIDDLETDLAGYSFGKKLSAEDRRDAARLMQTLSHLERKLAAAQKRAFDCENPHLSWY